jgi:hypothetical protein
VRHGWLGGLTAGERSAARKPLSPLGQVVAQDGQEVLDHLLKSGAGTAFYDAIKPDCRRPLTTEFLRLFESRYGGDAGGEVRHEYIACVAQNPA